MEKLNEFFNEVKENLLGANVNRKHPFRLCSLATIQEFPRLRTVVKRHTNEELCNYIYTDARSQKVKDILGSSRTSLLLYNHDIGLQVELKCVAEVIMEGEEFEQHNKEAMKNPQDYSTLLAPGTRISQKNYEVGTESHFCLLKLNPVSIHAFKLGAPKHLKAMWSKKEGWKGIWQVP